ncbi:MAG: hypothetical protein R3Y13_00865 [bacterium]
MNKKINKNLINGVLLTTCCATVLSVSKFNDLKDTNITTIKDESIVTKSNANLMSFEQETINEIAKVYNLDYNIVYSIISKSTNNFNDETYINNNIIPLGLQCNTYDLGNKAAAIMDAVKNIYLYPEAFGYTLEEITTKDKFVSELSQSEQIKKYSEMTNTDHLTAQTLTQYYTNIDSTTFTEKNNVLGFVQSEIVEDKNGNLSLSTDVITYPSSEAGFIDLSLYLLENNINGNYSFEELEMNLPINSNVDLNLSPVDELNNIYSELSEKENNNIR